MGPSQLGRGVILAPGQPCPVADMTEVSVDRSTLARPRAIVERLHEYWNKRTPVAVRLDVDASEFKASGNEVDTSEVWQLDPDFELWNQRLHFLVWNNNWDLRSGTPIWWWARKAVSCGAQALESGNSKGDIVLPGGEVAFVDGGPVGSIDAHLAVVSYLSVERGELRRVGHVDPVAELAADQLAAVSHSSGPARVIAPAGSGKTRVLTERLRHVIADSAMPPGSVCSVAYNTRAASEMNERTEGLGANIRTLNSLALAIVNGTSGFVRSSLVPQPRSVINEREVRQILREIVKPPRKTNSDPFAAWIEAFSAVRLGLRDPDDVEDDWDDVYAVAEAFTEYRSRLERSNVLDFDEQIYLAIEVLLRDPNARRVAQRKCRMMLVDEFQDLTPAHLLLVRVLSAPAFDVFGVGDDDQVIYGYAGANPRFLVEFDKWFPCATHYELSTNYRCPAPVVEAASNLLTRNKVRISKTITSARNAEADDELRIDQLEENSLASHTFDLLKRWLASGTPATEMAVLSRVNVTLMPIQILLSEADLAHGGAVDASVLQRTGMRTALAYLRIGLNPDRIAQADIAETVRRPSRKIARNVVDLMTKRPFTSLLELRSLARALSGSDVERVLAYVEDIGRLAQANETTSQMLTVIRDQVGLGETMDVLDGSRRHVDRSGHGDDLSALSAVAHLHPDPTTFEPWLESVLSRKSGPGGIELSTVHKVKGREWQRVVVFGANRDLLPHRLTSDRSEERRVFHVAITRATTQAVVVADRARPSPFVAELAKPGVAEETSRAAQLSRPTPEVKATPVPELDGQAGRVMEALRRWRKEAASGAGVPAYRVLHDSHLVSIASEQPQDLAELARCRGMGVTKLDRWGDEILSVVEEAVEV